MPFSLYHLNGFELLLLKYVLGYSDLIFVPLLIIMMDPDVRGGVGEVCRYNGNCKVDACHMSDCVSETRGLPGNPQKVAYFRI